MARLVGFWEWVWDRSRARAKVKGSEAKSGPTFELRLAELLLAGAPPLLPAQRQRRGQAQLQPQADPEAGLAGLGKQPPDQRDRVLDRRSARLWPGVRDGGLGFGLGLGLGWVGVGVRVGGWGCLGFGPGLCYGSARIDLILTGVELLDQA